jgi:hypothetical protein
MRIAVVTTLLEEKMTVVQVARSLQEVLRNLFTFCNIEPVSPLLCPLGRCRDLLVSARAIVSGVRWSTTAFGKEALPPTTASSREAKPNATMEGAAMRSRNHSSFG